jgi:hypothetical protein
VGLTSEDNFRPVLLAISRAQSLRNGNVIGTSLIAFRHAAKFSGSAICEQPRHRRDEETRAPPGRLTLSAINNDRPLWTACQYVHPGLSTCSSVIAHEAGACRRTTAQDMRLREAYQTDGLDYGQAYRIERTRAATLDDLCSERHRNVMGLVLGPPKQYVTARRSWPLPWLALPTTPHHLSLPKVFLTGAASGRTGVYEGSWSYSGTELVQLLSSDFPATLLSRKLAILNTQAFPSLISL